MSSGDIRSLAHRCAVSALLREIDHREFARGARAHRLIHDAALDDLRASGRGAILASFHLGPYLYVARPLVERGFHVVAIVDDDALGRARERWEHEAARMPGRLELMPLFSPRTLLRAVRALREGAIVAVFLDGGAGVAGPGPDSGRQIEVQFCSMPIRVRTGAAYLAQRAQVPILPAIAFRDSWGRRIVEYADLVAPPSRDDPEGAESLLRAILPWFERRVLSHPEQWNGWLLPMLMWARTGAAPSANRESVEQTLARVRVLLADRSATARLIADPVRVGAIERGEDRVLVDGARRLVLVTSRLGIRVMDAAQRRTRLADLPRRIPAERAELALEVTRLVLSGLASIDEPDRT